MNSPLRFGILGCGKIAPRHAAEAVKYGQLVAVCDIVKERADALASQFATKAVYSIDELLKQNIDLLAVCTPNGLHAEHSVKALNNGVNVLCEKPLAIAASDALSMMQAAHHNQRKLFVVKSTRYNPALAALKEQIDQNRLGTLYSFQLTCFWNRPEAYYRHSWRGSLALDGGALFTQFSHYIDALLWLFGDAARVCGFRTNQAHKGIIEFEDSGVVSILMNNGMMGGLNWSLNSYQKNMEASLTLIAEKATIRIAGEYMNKVEYLCASDISFPVAESGTANDYGFYKGSMSNHDKVYENMLKALHNENHPFTHAADGLKTVELIEKIYKSVSLQ